jgi:hypothetical protein
MIQKRSELMYERADAFREKTVIRKADEGKDDYGLDEKIAKAAKLQASLDKAKKTVSRTREKGYEAYTGNCILAMPFLLANSSMNVDARVFLSFSIIS